MAKLQAEFETFRAEMLALTDELTLPATPAPATA
ncbi:hypothetical protein ENKNEFLB_02084 [Nocardioides aquaticus]|uniref:Uncharacterized protein n=1 Tax=Nocardioides aquaticus TaxID=160826 RepID=A0ABX8EGQ7_9ACTN|nr:hypothetical protein ENKNEFLB_02084 [Nocardioides aquaticus]